MPEPTPQIQPAVAPQPASPPAPPVQSLSTDVIPFFIRDRMNKEKKEKRQWFKLFKLFILPLLTLTIFIGALILLTLPKLGEIFANLDSIGIALEEVDKLDTELANLDALKQISAQTTSDLEALNAAVPTGVSKVVDFQSRVIALAQQNSLSVSDATIGEQILNSNVDDTEPRNNLALVEIPASFTLRGSKEALVQFINDVLELEDFVIIGEMKLSIIAQVDVVGEEWTLQINFLKYQFPIPDSDNQLSGIYSSVPSTANADAEILQIVRK